VVIKGYVNSTRFGLLDNERHFMSKVEQRFAGDELPRSMAKRLLGCSLHDPAGALQDDVANLF
jgi:hypothetical protein